MSDKKPFFTTRAPKPKGPYAQAVAHRGVLYISGQVPLDPESGSVVRGTIEEETDAVLRSLQAIVEDAGSGMKDVLKTTCYLADLNDFERFNKIYKNYFFGDPPARTTLEVSALPLNVQVEIDAVVALPDKEQKFSGTKAR